jgi:hypothetical protein
VLAVADLSSKGHRVFIFYKDAGPAGNWLFLRVLRDRFSRPQGLFIQWGAQGMMDRPPSIVVADCGSNSLREYYVQRGETTATDVSPGAVTSTLVGTGLGCGTMQPRCVTAMGATLLVHLDKVCVMV